MSSRKLLRSIVKTRLWSQPWLAISCPRRTTSRSRGPCRRATQPSVKKVALDSTASNRSRISLMLRSTRSASPSQLSRSITSSNAPTWNQSSTSTDKPLTIGAGARRSGNVTAFTPHSLAASGGLGLVHLCFDPLDQHRQRLAHRALLLEELRFEPGDLLLCRGKLGSHRGARALVVLVRELDHRLLQLGDLHVALRQQRVEHLVVDPRLVLERRELLHRRLHFGHRLRRSLWERLLGVHLVEHRLEHAAVDPRPFLDRAEQQQPVGDLVDPPGDATAGFVELGEHALVELRVALPTHPLEPVDDVRLDLGALHRLQVMRRDHALAELLERGMPLQRRAKFRLAEQQRLQQRMVAELEVRQHPQLFECLDREVLRFIDDQQATPPCPGFFMEQALDGPQRARLVVAFYV